MSDSIGVLQLELSELACCEGLKGQGRFLTKWLLVATLPPMDTVGIKALKNKLSEYVRAAAAGETVLVTDRGRVVAELVAPRVRTDASSAEQRMGELVRQGLLTPAKVASKARLPRRRPVAKLCDVLRDLDRDRAER